MSPTEARVAICAAAGKLPDEDAVAVAELLALGTREELLTELRSHVDLEPRGKTFALTPTPRALWIKGLALQVWNAIAGTK